MEMTKEKILNTCYEIKENGGSACSLLEEVIEYFEKETENKCVNCVYLNDVSAHCIECCHNFGSKFTQNG